MVKWMSHNFSTVTISCNLKYTCAIQLLLKTHLFPAPPLRRLFCGIRWSDARESSHDGNSCFVSTISSTKSRTKLRFLSLKKDVAKPVTVEERNLIFCIFNHLWSYIKRNISGLYGTIKSYDQNLGGCWDNFHFQQKHKGTQFVSISELCYFTLCLNSFACHCGRTFIKSQNGAHTAFDYGSHYFWWISTDNS